MNAEPTTSDDGSPSPEVKAELLAKKRYWDRLLWLTIALSSIILLSSLIYYQFWMEQTPSNNLLTGICWTVAFFVALGLCCWCSIRSREYHLQTLPPEVARSLRLLEIRGALASVSPYCSRCGHKCSCATSKWPV